MSFVDLHTKQERKLLYMQYYDELKSIQPDGDWEKFNPVFIAMEYMEEPYAEWIDLYDGNRLIGFVIITSSGSDECPRGFDYFIAQAYVEPGYRHCGIMCEAMERFIDEHPGKYAYCTLTQNVYAKEFWHKLFISKGFEKCKVRDHYSSEADCESFGFMQKKKEVRT